MSPFTLCVKQLEEYYEIITKIRITIINYFQQLNKNKLLFAILCYTVFSRMPKCSIIHYMCI